MEKYIFDDNTKLIFVKNNTILIQNNKLKLKEKLDDDFYNRLLNYQKENTILTASNELFTSNEIKFLKKNKIIKKLSMMSEKYLNTKYEKYQFYLENNYSDASNIDYIKINNTKKILFVGAGGICTGIVDYLISVGFNNLGFIDFDRVEITNFNRQFKYNDKDIGFLKIETLKNNLLLQYPDLSISIYDKKIMSSSDLNDIVKIYNPNFIICAADTPILLIQKYIVEVCKKNKIACIFGGVGQKKGSIGPLLYNNKGFDKYLNQTNKVLNIVDGIFPCKGSFGVTNSLVANYMAKDVINYMMNKRNEVLSLNKEFEIDFDRNEIYEKRIY